MAENLPTAIASVRVIRSVVVSTLAVIIIFGNLLVLIILPRVRSCKGNPRLFLTSLTMADLMAGMFVAIPMAISSVADKWIFGDMFCNFFGRCSDCLQHRRTIVTFSRYGRPIYRHRVSSALSRHSDTTKEYLHCRWHMGSWRSLYLWLRSSF